MTVGTRCYFDISVDREPVGRVVFELYDSKTPKTCENFKHLCLGDKGIGKTTGKKLHYKGCPFHRVIKNFMVQSGDFSAQNGTGGESIYGGSFDDENFDVKHDRAGLLSMANAGPNTNGSQFFITTASASHLDGKHVVFGHVTVGMDIVRHIERQAGEKEERPKVPIFITDCGVLAPGESTGIVGDTAADKYPEFPEDYQDSKLELDRLMEITKDLKRWGNDFYKSGKYQLAYAKYNKAIRYLKKKERWELKGSDEKDQVQLALVSMHLNRAASALKTNKFYEANRSTTFVLEEVADMEISASDRLKAHFRRGQARTALNEFDLAMDDFKKAAKLSPDDEDIKAEMEKTMLKSKEFLEKEKSVYSRMFA